MKMKMNKKTGLYSAVLEAKEKKEKIKILDGVEPKDLPNEAKKDQNVELNIFPLPTMNIEDIEKCSVKTLRQNIYVQFDDLISDRPPVCNFPQTLNLLINSRKFLKTFCETIMENPKLTMGINQTQINAILYELRLLMNPDIDKIIIPVATMINQYFVDRLYVCFEKCTKEDVLWLAVSINSNPDYTINIKRSLTEILDLCNKFNISITDKDLNNAINELYPRVNEYHLYYLMLLPNYVSEKTINFNRQRLATILASMIEQLNRLTDINLICFALQGLVNMMRVDGITFQNIQNGMNGLFGKFVKNNPNTLFAQAFNMVMTNYLNNVSFEGLDNEIDIGSNLVTIKDDNNGYCVPNVNICTMSARSRRN